MGISTVLALISSIPKLFQVFKLIKPIKEKVLEVEAIYEKKAIKSGIVTTTKEEVEKINASKHAAVIEALPKSLKAGLKLLKIDAYDIDTMIRFVVLFIRKVKKLRRFKG